MSVKGYVNTISGGQFSREAVPIIFTEQDLEKVDIPHTNPLIIKLRIGNNLVSRVLIDGGSSSDILFWDTFRMMGLKKEEILPIKTSLHAFNGAEVKPLGMVVLPVYAADRVIMVKFLVVDTPSAMNVIMRREWIHAVRGIVSTLHQVMRCQSPDGLYTIDIKGDQSQNRRCYIVENKEGGVRKMTNHQIEKFDRAKDKQDKVPEDGSTK